MLFSLGKLLQSLRDKQEQEESAKLFLAGTSQVSWRNAALAEDASEKGEAASPTLPGTQLPEA